MVNINILTTILCSIFEICISHMFFSKFGKITHTHKIYCIELAFITTLSIIVSLTLTENGFVLAGYSTCVFLHSMLFNIKFFKKALISLCVIITAALSEMISTMALTIKLNIDIPTILNNSGAYFLCVIISKFLTFSILKTIKLNNKESNTKSPFWFTICSASLPFSSLLIIILLYRYSFLVNDENYQLFTIIAAILLIISNLLIFYIIDKQEEYYITKERLLLTELHLEKQLNHYSELYAHQEMLKKFHHDSKNLYISLVSILETLTTKEAIKYIKDNLSIAVDKFELENSGNPVIDAIIHSKKELCKQKDIVIKHTIRITNKINIDALELGVLIGNALDNAVEATSQISHPQKKEILLKIVSCGDMISIEVTNPTSRIMNTQNMQTTKENKSLHGYGLRGIASIAEKYNGNLSISYENNSFILSAILVNKK